MSPNQFFPVVPHCAAANCKSEKRDVNHWYMVKTSRTKAGRLRVIVLHWDDGLIADHDVRPLCGLECLHKELDRVLCSREVPHGD